MITTNAKRFSSSDRSDCSDLSDHMETSLWRSHLLRIDRLPIIVSKSRLQFKTKPFYFHVLLRPRWEKLVLV